MSEIKPASKLTHIMNGLRENTQYAFVKKEKVNIPHSVDGYSHNVDLIVCPMGEGIYRPETLQTILESFARCPYAGQPDSIGKFSRVGNRLNFGSLSYTERIGEFHTDEVRKIDIDDDVILNTIAIWKELGIDRDHQITIKSKGMTGALIRKIAVRLYPNKKIAEDVQHSTDEAYFLKYGITLEELEKFK
ncbi:MAG: hypothetical protein KJ697_01210 [Nanoarchaeota archaeon]|nr:hypothetical protein [Nanoarchaeota archaeon]MBU4123865.1 hypothetical protein [Nanoarchaeota archaeon]